MKVFRVDFGNSHRPARAHGWFLSIQISSTRSGEPLKRAQKRSRASALQDPTNGLSIDIAVIALPEGTILRSPAAPQGVRRSTDLECMPGTLATNVTPSGQFARARSSMKGAKLVSALVDAESSSRKFGSTPQLASFASGGLKLALESCGC